MKNIGKKRKDATEMFITKNTIVKKKKKLIWDVKEKIQLTGYYIQVSKGIYINIDRWITIFNGIKKNKKFEEHFNQTYLVRVCISFPLFVSSRILISSPISFDVFEYRQD